MKNLIKLEEVGMFIISVYMIKQLSIHFQWWLYIILFFLPDIGIGGYIINTKVGAFTYNLLHHKGIASIIILSGMYFKLPYLILSGLILFAHSSFDRILNYGLKYNDNFKHTHLGYIK